MAKKVTGGDEQTGKAKKPFYKKIWFWVLAVVVVTIIGAAGNSGNKNEEKTKEATTEKVNKKPTTIKDFVKASKVKTKSVSAKDGNVIVVLKDGMELSNNTLLQGFAQNTALILEQLYKKKDVQNVIVRRPTELTDTKGNKSSEVVLSAFFTRDTMSSINFKDWPGIVYGKPFNFFSNADQYFIHNAIYSAVDSKYLGTISATGSDGATDWSRDNLVMSVE